MIRSEALLRRGKKKRGTGRNICIFGKTEFSRISLIVLIIEWIHCFDFIGFIFRFMTHYYVFGITGVSCQPSHSSQTIYNANASTAWLMCGTRHYQHLWIGFNRLTTVFH